MAEQFAASASKLLAIALPGGRRIALSFAISLDTFVISLLTAVEVVLHQEILSMVSRSIIVLIEPIPNPSTWPVMRLHYYSWSGVSPSQLQLVSVTHMGLEYT